MAGYATSRDAALPEMAQLVADHHQAIYRYAYRLAGSVPDAEDFTQQVFLIAQQKLSQLHDAERARGWLFTILRNCFLKSRRQRAPLPLAQLEEEIPAIPESEMFIDSERLQAALNSLGDEFKIVVLMFYFEYRSYREIAELLDLPLGTVMSRLARAKTHLRRQLCEPREQRTTRQVVCKTLDPQASFSEPSIVRR